MWWQAEESKNIEEQRMDVKVMGEEAGDHVHPAVIGCRER